MSTPITHNQMTISAIVEVVEALQGTGQMPDDCEDMDTVLGLVRECVALYNYPDAVQAVRREDGSIMSRRVSHFEASKTAGAESNWHKIFTPEFLQGVDEMMPVHDDDFYDTADQTGDLMGQYTDWHAWDQAKKAYIAENIENPRARLLVELAEAHLAVADWFNDKMFRKYVRPLEDGSVMIGVAKFGPEEKREAFGKFKNLLMKLQEEASALMLACYFEDDDLNDLNLAVEESYKDAYSPWLAENTLKYVKPITLEATDTTEDELELLAQAGIDNDSLEEEVARFVNETVALTADRIWSMAYLMETLR